MMIIREIVDGYDEYKSTQSSKKMIDGGKIRKPDRRIIRVRTPENRQRLSQKSHRCA